MTNDQHDNQYEDDGAITSGVASRAYDEWELPCVACGGDLVQLGQLGSLNWYRCRWCGIDQSIPA